MSKTFTFRDPIDWIKLFNTVGIVTCLALVGWVKWEQRKMADEVQRILIWVDAPQKVQTYLIEER